ncbi:MAG TPA: DNA polymerase Y family protein, partial [Actinophytocola sp.]|nr:DNA polymerase Y family protein [Actinophytocola sp.]
RVPRADPDAPWPGRLPAPSPRLVPSRPVPAAVLDETGSDIGVSARFELTGRPRRVAVNGPPREVRGWAGPWPADERWWEPDSAHRCARLQVLTEDSALLLVWEHDLWTVEGVYD